MTKEEYIADIRNKLSPIKNYVALNREYWQLKSSALDSYDGYRLEELEELLKQEREVVEKSFAQIEYILEKFENL